MPRLYTLSDEYDTIEYNNDTAIVEEETISMPEMSRQYDARDHFDARDESLNEQYDARDNLVQIISDYNQVKDFHVIDIIED